MESRREELADQIQRLKEVRSNLGLNRRQFSDYMEIPLRTIEEWEAGRRKMPAYVLRLIEYYTRMEKDRQDKK